MKVLMEFGADIETHDAVRLAPAAASSRRCLRPPAGAPLRASGGTLA